MNCHHCLAEDVRTTADGACPVCGTVICSDAQLGKRRTLRRLVASVRRLRTSREARAKRRDPGVEAWTMRLARRRGLILPSIGALLFIAICGTFSNTAWKHAFGRGYELDSALVRASTLATPRRILRLVRGGADVDTRGAWQTYTPLGAAAGDGRIGV